MTDLQKEIEELKKLSEQKINLEPEGSNYDDMISQGYVNGETSTAKQALSIINQLQKELEAVTNATQEIITENARLSEEIKQLNETSESVAVEKEKVNEKKGYFEGLPPSKEAIERSQEESIWKPVNELNPNDIIPQGFVQNEEGGVSISTIAMTVKEWENIIVKYTPIAEFINDHEKLKERDKLREVKLRELEQRLENLEKLNYPF